MRPLLLVLVVAAAACGNARKHDCNQLRDALGDLGAPRRYYDYSEPPRTSPRAKLKAMTWYDDEIRAAVARYTADDMPSTGWTTYTPYSVGDSAPVSLRALCAD